MKSKPLFISCTLLILAFVALIFRNPMSVSNTQGAMRITSSAFEAESLIPPLYTCIGKDISPPLSISGVPADAKTLVIILDDPDTSHGTFTHWVRYNIPASTVDMPEGTADTFGMGALNGAGTTEYVGPCPPTGVHRYYFHLFALDTELSLSGKIDRSAVEKAMQGHVRATAELMGKYGKGM